MLKEKFVGLIVGMLIIFAAVSSSSAHNKTVVIPLFSEDVASIKNVITVAKQGGDFKDPISAIESITDVSNPYLIIIAPGEYSLSEPMVMKSNVDIAGSGENVTSLLGSFSSDDPATAATLVTVDGARLSNLKIVNVDNGSGNYRIGIHNPSVDDVEISNVKILVSEGGSDLYGIYNVGSSIVLSSVTIELSSGSLDQYGIFSGPGVSRNIIRESKILISLNGPLTGADYGIFHSLSSNASYIVDSTIDAKDASLSAGMGSGRNETYVTNSFLDGVVTGDPKCSFVHSSRGLLLNSSCALPPP